MSEELKSCRFYNENGYSNCGQICSLTDCEYKIEYWQHKYFKEKEKVERLKRELDKMQEQLEGEK